MTSINYSKETRFVDLPIEIRCFIKDLDNHIMKISLDSSKGITRHDDLTDIAVDDLFEVLLFFILLLFYKDYLSF